MMFLGIVWAVFAPLLLLIPMFVIYLAAGWIPGFDTKLRKISFAATITLSATLFIWLHDLKKFETHCQAVGQAQIFENRKVDGFFLDDGTANSFGMRYLQEEGFLWMEARSIYNRNGFTRYEVSPTGITEKEIDKLTAAIEVKSIFSEDAISSTTQMTITDRQSGKVLALAGDAYFNGGASLFLGAWGTQSCTSPNTTSGAEAFRQFYHLAKLTLR